MEMEMVMRLGMDEARRSDLEDDGVNRRITMVSSEENVPERRPRNPVTIQEETEASGDPLQMKKAGVCICIMCAKKRDHWTSQCPDTVLYMQRSFYIPESMRAGISRRTNDNSVKVTNLPEDTREPELYELFRPFGPIRRVYVPIWTTTGTSIDLGYVNFMNMEDGQGAIDTLNGYCYANRTLRVERIYGEYNRFVR